MAEIPWALVNWNLFVDGRGLAGRITSFEPPKLTVKTEEYRAGGMDAPVAQDMGMEILEATFTLGEYTPDVLKLWGLADGNAAALTGRGAIRRDGEPARPIVVNMRGLIAEHDPGTWEAGGKTEAKFTVKLRYYRLAVNGEDLIEIDVMNMIRKIGGVDQLESIRAAIGA